MAMQVSIERITPARAKKMLNDNPTNRPLREGVVESYARDMSNDAWTECLMPIAFYEDGTMANGQHRLWAIIESGTTQEFIIIRKLPRRAGLNIDTGINRTLVDNARISGVDTELSNEIVACAKGIEFASRGNARESNAFKMIYVTKHREAAAWAISHSPRGNGMRNALITSAIGRAYYHESDRDKLGRFGVVMGTGFSDGPHESAAIAMRNHVMSQTRGYMHTAIGWRDVHLKAQHAIKLFMRGKPLTMIKTIKDESYPLPKKVT